MSSETMVGPGFNQNELQATCLSGLQRETGELTAPHPLFVQKVEQKWAFHLNSKEVGVHRWHYSCSDEGKNYTKWLSKGIKKTQLRVI